MGTGREQTRGKRDEAAEIFELEGRGVSEGTGRKSERIKYVLCTFESHPLYFMYFIAAHMSVTYSK